MDNILQHFSAVEFENRASYCAPRTNLSTGNVTLNILIYILSKLSGREIIFENHIKKPLNLGFSIKNCLEYKGVKH